MNINIGITHLRQSIVTLLLCVFVVSCSQDCLETGEPLPPGKYPLIFTATVDGVRSRSDGKDQWADGDVIGVKIGAGPAIGRYKLNDDGSIQDPMNKISWLNTDEATVTGWFPLEAQNSVSIADQSQGIKDFDFLTASESGHTYMDRIELNFKHQMAKVTCVLKQDDGISNEEWKTLKLRFAGHTEASFTEGVLTGTKHDWITPKFDDEASDSEKPLYEALLVPQDMSGREFIRIDIKVNVNNNIVDKTFIFKPAEGNLQAGTHYKYNITVKKDRLEVQSLSASWEDNGDWHPAGPAVFHVKLPENVTLPADMAFSDNVTTDGKYLLVKGNRFTISYEVTDDNMSKIFQIYTEAGESDRDIVNRTVTEIADDKFIYYFNYYLLSEEVSLKYVDKVQVGDYYYDNGTWGPLELKGSKTPIGVVFKVGAGGDDGEDTYNKGWDEIHGYAVAINDAVDDPINWGASLTAVETFGNATKALAIYSGYNHTKKIKAWGETGKAYDAVKAVIDYEPKAPESSSGWYLPTLQQLIDIENILPDRASCFTDVQGEDVKPYTSTNIYYWSCLEVTSAKAWAWKFGSGTSTDNSAKETKTSKAPAGYVRAVLTF